MHQPPGHRENNVKKVFLLAKPGISPRNDRVRTRSPDLDDRRLSLVMRCSFSRFA